VRKFMQHQHSQAELDAERRFENTIVECGVTNRCLAMRELPEQASSVFLMADK
jgi:hypothetical protein